MHKVAAATSNVTVLMACSAALIHYAVLGQVNLDFALIFGAGGIIAAILSVICLSAILKIFKRPSIVAFTLAGLTFVGMVVVFVFGVMSIITDLTTHDWTWGTVGST